MVQLITLADAKTGLRIEGTDSDAMLEALIPAASEAIVNYLKDQAAEIIDLDAAVDSPADAGVPDIVKRATILLVGIWFRNPDGDPDLEFDPGNLPKPVTAILYPLRDPQVS